MIRMQLNSNPFRFLVGDLEVLKRAPEIPSLPVFSDRVISFLSDVSNALLSNPKAKKHPDVVAFAFFIRRMSLTRLCKIFKPVQRRIGRGFALHFAPSNVPVNFAVSMMDSLLAGNVTVVRVSEKEAPQILVICAALRDVIDHAYPDLRPYLVVMQYPHDNAITDELSCACDVRVIWGGNQTIAAIRQSPIRPRTVELCFADRHSLLVIDSESVVSGDIKKIAREFYIDTYYTDQNACSSPRLIVWTGGKIPVAKEKFWTAVKDEVIKSYDMPPIKVIDKMDAFCRLAVAFPGVKLGCSGNSIWRISVPKLRSDLMDYKESAGFFFEYETQSLADILPVLTKPAQTIAYLGIEPDVLWRIVVDAGVRGVDRIVPIGHTMDISFLWDGCNMIESMSRIVDVV